YGRTTSAASPSRRSAPAIDSAHASARTSAESASSATRERSSTKARGHITQRGKDSWALIVELERHPATGDRRQKWNTFRGNKRYAETGLARLVTEAEGGRLGMSPKMTVGEYLGR